MNFNDASNETIDQALNKAWDAFHVFRKTSLKQRADFMREIGTQLSASANLLVQTASKETNLPEQRLHSELTRTIFQLNNYASETEKGSWLDLRIDTSDDSRKPPKPGLCKMNIAMGPVVVYGASNFPFAYSTAGGDTACAFAAGCPVIVKAHPAHPETSYQVAEIIHKAVKSCSLPEGVFAHIYGKSPEVGKALVTHRYTKAVGFTGSLQGGKALFNWANQRVEPIPVFAEMGSTNPVFLFPGKLKESPEETAAMFAASITLGVGQFCTNPGLMFAIEGPELNEFINHLSHLIQNSVPGKMLHTGIAKNFQEKKKEMMSRSSVLEIAMSSTPADHELMAAPVIATTSASAYLSDAQLQEEVFGPYSMLVKCVDKQEMLDCVKATVGQLTCTVMAMDSELVENDEIIEAIKNICGRLIFNNVPTGVEVCNAMQHGGPYPASTDSRFTSVGADGIKRFVRPLSFQNWPDSMLPDELKVNNPLNLWRVVNGELKK